MKNSKKDSLKNIDLIMARKMVDGYKKLSKKDYSRKNNKVNLLDYK